MASQLERDLAQLLEESKQSIKIAEDASTPAPETSNTAPTELGNQLRKLASAVRNYKGIVTYDDLNRVLTGSNKK